MKLIRIGFIQCTIKISRGKKKQTRNERKGGKGEETDERKREMGASSSTEQVSVEQKEAESLAASTGALPMLQKAFASLADPQTNTIPLHSLQVSMSNPNSVLLVELD